jgi:hypothetical protein
MLPALILPLLNVLGINIFPGQDAWSPTVPFDKNKHYSVSALSILCCCIMISNVMRKKFIGWWVPVPMKPVGYGSLAICIALSFLVTYDTYHRALSMLPKSEEKND